MARVCFMCNATIVTKTVLLVLAKGELCETCEPTYNFRRNAWHHLKDMDAVIANDPIIKACRELLTPKEPDAPAR